MAECCLALLQKSKNNNEIMTNVKATIIAMKATRGNEINTFPVGLGEVEAEAEVTDSVGKLVTEAVLGEAAKEV